MFCNSRLEGICRLILYNSICNSSEKSERCFAFQFVLSIFVGHTTNTESVSLFSDTNLENSKRENRPTSSRVISIRGYRRGAVAYFNKSVDKYINLTNRLLRRFYRGFSNDLENVRNSLLCVIILSNNPCQKQRQEFSLNLQKYSI